MTTILGVPGPWKSLPDLVKRVVRESGGFATDGKSLLDTSTEREFRLELYPADPLLWKAYEIAGRGTFGKADLDAVRAHRHCVYLVADGGSAELARDLLPFAFGLIAAGGVAVKVESAGIAHTPTAGKTLNGSRARMQAMYEAYVAVIEQSGRLHSCGMHNLGRRDASVPIGSAAQDTLRSLLLATLIDDLKPSAGETFSISEAAPTYRLSDAPTQLHAADDLFFNPFGVWELSPA
jgi:hypothetical protein